MPCIHGNLISVCIYRRLLRRMERIEDVMEKETIADTPETEGNTNHNNANISEVSKTGICAEVKQNGHLSSDDSLSPEMEIVENGEVDVSASGAAAATNSPPSIVTCHSITTTNGPATNQSASPNSFSPNSKPPRGSSPQNCSNHNNSAANQQHVVHVHISQGETFSVRVGEQIQRIQGRFMNRQ